MGAKDLSNRSKQGDIAVVGMACRFPGLANDPDAFWKILADGKDVVTQIDDSRWSKEHYFHADPKQVGRTYTWAAGVVDNIDSFDAEFFGISPREAAQMDPQQRLLLEMVWEALEDGGQVPARLAQSNCGVYIGISGTDYANSRIDDPASGDAYTMTGGTLSIAANRISYLFDLLGPSMVIDTACSSSLVALHQACQSIWRGETDAAIAGGINLLLVPFNFIGFARASMLSPRGRCRAFDASGDGYVRSEGGAVLYLKPLAQAKADGDRIHAVIAASGVNSDGRTKGLSMPSSAAQERLLRQVYGDAGLDPANLLYLEAHGTGTAAGDPQEARAIGRALGQARPPEQPLPIGSVKTNVGHLEPASGMAGVVKSILVLKHGEIPKTLHLEEPNPNIPFDEFNLELVTEHTPVDETALDGLVGVNSFGFGGTNAHVVLRAHKPSVTKTSSPRRKLAPLMLSARSEAALVGQARAYSAMLRKADAPTLYDVAHNAANRRQHHNHRLVVWGSNAQSMRSALADFSNGKSNPNVVAGKAVGSQMPVALLFSGNGSQWSGMAQSLLKSDRVFRRTVNEVDEIFQPFSDFSIVRRLTANPEQAKFDLTEVAQPALFAVQAGLLATMKARGLAPAFVLGHSVGEVAAAYASGAFDLEQGTRLIFERSRAQSLTRGAGRMAAIGLGGDDALAALIPFKGNIEIAAYNSAGAVTVSGPLTDLEALGEALNQQGHFYRLLDLDYAFHSRVMDPVKDDLLERLAAAGLRPGECTTPMISTVTGEVLKGADLGPEYWWRNIREPVRLDKAMAAVLSESHPVVVEVGPHSIMQGYVRDAFRTADCEPASLGTLKRDGDDEADVAAAIYGCYNFGAELTAKKLFPVKSGPVGLPLYPWQRERYWYQLSNESLGLLGPRYIHPLLGYAVPKAEHV